MRKTLFGLIIVLCSAQSPAAQATRTARPASAETPQNSVTIQLARPARTSDVPSPGALAPAAISTPTGTAYGAGAISGRYILSYRGTDTAARGTLVTAGYLDADGKGNLTGAGFAVTADFGALNPLYYTGNYLVYADGHGTAWLKVWDRPDNLILRETRLELQVVSSSLVYVATLDPFAVGTGTLERQGSIPTNSPYSGDFVFGLNGDDSIYPLSAVGRFTVGAFDGISGTATISNGYIDINDGGSVVVSLPLSGTISMRSEGAAIATLDFPPYQIQFQLYALSSDKIVAVSLDPIVHLTGYAERQGSPGTTVSGTYSVRGSSPTPAPPFALAGVLTFNAGNLTGVVDQTGAPNTQYTFSGTSTSIIGGRSGFTMQSGSNVRRSLSAYWVSPQKAYWLQTNYDSPPIDTISGVLERQDTDTFDATTVQGRYHLILSGAHNNHPATVSATLNLLSGQFDGIEDANDNFALAFDAFLSGSYFWDGYHSLLTVPSGRTWSFYPRARDTLFAFGGNTVASTDEIMSGLLLKAQPPVLPDTANLSLSVTPSDAPTVGAYLTFTATLVNHGPGTATGVWLSDTLPLVLGMVAPPITKGHCGDTLFDDPWLGNPPTLYCAIGSLAPGEQVTWTLTTVASQAATVTDVMQVALNETDPDASDNAAFTQVSITNPVPSITAISPEHVVAGSSGFSLYINGRNFVQNAVVYWNGSARTPSTVYENVIYVPITAADIATAGDVQVTVVNPAPGGGTAGPATFTVDPKPPVSLSSASLNFNGVLFYSASAPQSVTVFNNQSVPLHVTRIEAPADFVYSADCGTVAAGGSCTVIVWWRPTGWGQQYTLRIDHDGPGGTSEVQLLGYPIDLTFWLARPARNSRSAAPAIQSQEDRKRTQPPE